MSILDRASLEESSLADLHAIASELSIDSFRRLRKAELIDAILQRQSPSEEEEERVEAGEPAAEAEAAEAEVGQEMPGHEDDTQPRRRRLRRGRRRDRDDDVDATPTEAASADEPPAAEETAPAEEGPPPQVEEPRGHDADLVEGEVEVLAGGSGFVRVDPPAPSDGDVYVSAAQVRRFELVSGDRVSGPMRPPRRSERFASLVRVESVNGRPASELGDVVPFDEQPVAWPTKPLPLDLGDPTVSAVLSVVPLGCGSRVTITGPAQSGKTETIRRLASAIALGDGFELQVVLCGVRPEEIAEWRQGSVTPAVAIGLGASADVRGQAVEAAIEQARRMAVRGAHAVVLIDTLDGLAEAVKVKALAAARAIVDGGSVTVIASSSAPLGGETSVIGLSALLATAGHWPALDPVASWTMRPERLVGEARADELVRARAQALDR